MIDRLIDPDSRSAALRRLYGRLRFAENVAVLGLNDVGKTTLLALAQAPEVVRRFGDALTPGPRLFVHVDCNLMSAADEHELFVVMARGLAAAARHAALDDVAARAEEFVHGAADGVRSGVSAALELEALLSYTLGDGRAHLCFLFDEFDGAYRRMPARAALSLRAFHNRLGPALAFVVAIDQPLQQIRGDGGGSTDEFEEMFLGGVQVLPPLDVPAATAFAHRHLASRDVQAPEWAAPLIATLCGGHPGLLWAACGAAQRLDCATPDQLERDLAASDEVRNECENVWRRLTPSDRDAVLAALSGGPPGAALDGLRERGLIAPGDAAGIALPLLDRHVRRLGTPRSSGLRFDPQSGEVSVNGTTLGTPLGPTEFRLLQALHGRRGALVTKDEIARAVWPDEERLGGVDDARIDKLVDRLRAKIEPNPRSPRFLVTARGLGYRLLTE